MATHQQTTVTAFQCPDCGETVASENYSWQCGDCGYVPGHGSD